MIEHINQQPECQLVQYEKQSGELSNIQNPLNKIKIAKNKLTQDTNKMIEALNSNYQHQHRHQRIQQFDQQQLLSYSKYKTQSKQFYQSVRQIKTQTGYEDYNEKNSHCNIDNVGKSQKQFEHKNPAHMKVYKINKNRQQKSKDKQNKGRMSMENKNIDKDVINNRLSLPLRTMKPRGKIEVSREENCYSPSCSKEKSVDRKIVCPTCKTKIFRIVLNSENQRSPSPKALKQNSNKKTNQNADKYDNENQIIYSILNNIQIPIKNVVLQTRQLVMNQLTQFANYFESNKTKIVQKLKSSDLQLIQKQQKLFTLEIQAIGSLQRIKKLQMQLEALRFQNTFLAQQVQKLMQTSYKRVEYQQYQNNKQVLDQPIIKQRKSAKLTYPKRKQENDDLYQNRMLVFQDRTEYSQKILLKKNIKKDNKHVKHQNNINFEQTSAVSSTRSSKRQKDLSQIRNKSLNESAVYSQLELLENLLESRLAYNY